VRCAILGPGEDAGELQMATARLPFTWDYDLDEGGSGALLEGRRTLGRLDRNWAAVRLPKHASYPEIQRLQSLRDLVDGWPSWCGWIRPPAATPLRAMG
jgi:hypothetical protein